MKREAALEAVYAEAQVIADRYDQDWNISREDMRNLRKAMGKVEASNLPGHTLGSPLFGAEEFDKPEPVVVLLGDMPESEEEIRAVSDKYAEFDDEDLA